MNTKVGAARQGLLDGARHVIGGIITQAFTMRVDDLLGSFWQERERQRWRQRDASACMRRHQGFALAPVATSGRPCRAQGGGGRGHQQRRHAAQQRRRRQEPRRVLQLPRHPARPRRGVRDREAPCTEGPWEQAIEPRSKQGLPPSVNVHAHALTRFVDSTSRERRFRVYRRHQAVALAPVWIQSRYSACYE